MTYSALAAPRFATCAGTRWFRHAPRTLDHNEPDRKNPFKPVASNWLAEHRLKLARRAGSLRANVTSDTREIASNFDVSLRYGRGEIG